MLKFFTLYPTLERIQISGPRGRGRGIQETERRTAGVKKSNYFYTINIAQSHLSSRIINNNLKLYIFLIFVSPII